LLRYAELVGEPHRVFAVLKMRFSDFNRTLRVYTIEDGVGIKIAGPAPRAEGLLTGLARPLTSEGDESPAFIEPRI
jgi:KaiC/GvpD/RAD55 family RecA-like ATPase